MHTGGRPLRVEGDDAQVQPEASRGQDGDEFTVQRVVAYRSVRLALSGVVDARSARRLAELLAQACHDPQVDAVVLDLEDVTYFGAAGLGCVNQAAELGLGLGIRLSVWHPRPFLRRVLTAGGLHPSVLIEPPDPH
jgi:anti-anti-sigma factor